MTEHQYYPEEVLIEKTGHGQYSRFNYVNHLSPGWQEEYTRHCKKHGLVVGNELAAEFVHYRDEQLEAAMKSGDVQRKPLQQRTMVMRKNINPRMINL